MKPLLLATALSLALLPAAHGQPAAADFSQVPLDRLKAHYLACDHAATRSVLHPATAALCSAVAEALLRRGFGGDFDGLLAWWRVAREAPSLAAVR